MTEDLGMEAEAPGVEGEVDDAESSRPEAADAISEVAADTQAQLEGLQKDLEALNERHLRLAAEFDNYRKRIERERTELWARAQADLVKQLLDTLDDLQRVIDVDATGATAASVVEGVALIEKKLRHALESAGLEPIDPAGEFFNPATMEALMTVPAEHPEEDDVVADVFQKGYRFKDHLIRPARVRVKKYG